MNSKDWILNACDISTDSSLFLSDKETQTSKIYLINSVSSNIPSRFLPQNIESVAKHDNPKVYEFCETIQDPDNPDSVITIKETFTEELLTDSDCIFDKPTKNKYKYCKEVIQPFSNSAPKDCPKHFSKCKHIPQCKESCQKKNQEDCLNDKEKTMNSDKCKTTFVNPKNPANSCDKKEEEKKCCSKESIKDEKPSCEESKSPVCQKAEPFDQCKLKRCVSACISESFNLAKKGSATCLEKFEKVIGVQKPQGCNEKPTYYVMEKSKSETDSANTSVPEKNSVSSIFDSQNKTVANITCAIKGFMGTVYNKTIDAVNMIKTESCRHLGINDDPKPTSKENKTAKKTKECSSEISETKASSLYNIKGESSNKETDESYNIEKILEPAKEVIEQVASAVSSTVSILRNSSFEQIVDDILDAKMEKSSAYDNPDPSKCSPKKIAHDHEPGTNSSVFTMLKAKILSIFDIQQESCQDGDNNDEDDDNTAEKIFEKFCEQ
ncbi:unnamed protein product [Euphydryas editha]|uniref:Uncharacterized protein n=1 Tax=Euphydryas editha TaxID=104508 RepID=A0AAU9UI94_EUPED|nr:unnamed protein product [Euphydryas editha]